jgi:hypothetical protein
MGFVHMNCVFRPAFMGGPQTYKLKVAGRVKTVEIVLINGLSTVKLWTGGNM